MRKIAAILTGIALAASCSGGNDAGLDALYEGLPFDMPRVQSPSIPAHEAVLTDFGGVGDGVALNTQAFADAIAALEKQGGGRVVVPAGVWRTGPIELKSHIELNVDKDAVVVFDPDQGLYPIIDTNFEGLDVRRCVSPLNATGAHDIAVTGARSSAARSPTTSGRPSSSGAASSRKTALSGSRMKAMRRPVPRPVP